MYYLNLDFYRYFIGRDDQSVNEKVMIRRLDQQMRVNRIMAESFLKREITNAYLEKYMFNYLTIITAVSSILAIKSGTDEHLTMKKQLWAELKALDAEYQSVVEQGSKDTLLFGDRFPFRYLTDDYKLEYYAAFAGCSAETEASFETIAFLAEKVDELGLNSVMVIENSDTRIAETIISTTKTQNQQIVVMNSMQSTTSKDVENGASYLNIMKENLESIKIALQ